MNTVAVIFAAALSSGLLVAVFNHVTGKRTREATITDQVVDAAKGALDMQRDTYESRIESLERIVAGHRARIEHLENVVEQYQEAFGKLPIEH